MEYHEAINTLERLRRLRPEMGTESTAALLAHLGDPHEDLSAVQIAGSNGKGSTASVLERILREGGLTVGLYTSPDLNELRERIQVRGRPIPKSAVVQFVETVWPYVVERSVEGRAPTFFEVFTALALWHFDRADVDLAVLEVGIGGRYDATSVVDPDAAAVTSVSLEHTDILGSTVEEIARDKAQVAPETAPLVTGATGDALEVIREETDVVTVGSGERTRDGFDDPDEHSGASRDVQVNETDGASATESSISLAGPDWEVHTRTPLLGPHQAENAGIAATLARQVSDVTEAEIAAGIRNVRWPGRFEVMEETPLVILDGAHNPDACATLTTLLERFEYDACHLVFGAMRDKDHREMCRALPDPDRVFLAEPAVDRAQDTETLAATFERETDADLTRSESVLTALNRALQVADETECVLVTGSLYLVGEARDWWTQTPRVVRTETAARARSVMKHTDVAASTRRDHADRLVHRTVRLHARRDGARELQELAWSLGATCVVSGIEASDKHVQVALSGTLEQFTALLRELRGRTVDAGPLVGRLNEVLGIGVTEPTAEYPWTGKTAVMGILDVSPESVHDDEDDAGGGVLTRAEELVAAGADVVDVVANTRFPGAGPVSAEVERERVRPVVERLESLEALVSVATQTPSVAETALEVGADVVTDGSGLTSAEMRHVVAEHDVPAVLGHSPTIPVSPGHQSGYDDAVEDVLAELTERVLLAERAGIDRSNLVVDPGAGLGKRGAECFELLDRLEEFRGLGTSVAVGPPLESSAAGAVPGTDADVASTVAATTLAAARGVDLVRAHDVEAAVAAVETAGATTGYR